MANRSGWALLVITAFILLICAEIFLSRALKKREDYSIEFDNAEFNYKYDLQVKRNGDSNREQNNHVLHHSEKSRFRAATCQEDLQHINEIENTNVEATSSSQLTEILYKSVTRPVQGKFHEKTWAPQMWDKKVTCWVFNSKFAKKYWL